ncbi:hypothetical protein O0I10_004325 [Lichtheimia ornata]|uniref:Hyaluronan/mRNA-binding protein domain-containing protein n=1 Tax=Lichtheimia ornata TaxID=688661 RepID=A0AAD7Y0J9_9FUNG|nr:uncharacterized protein O0I10_004325 [Lichtheimia ornata]KAJ8660096.1 hypothetical protein O0I10_004325 [Lichtheimia ornata]
MSTLLGEENTKLDKLGNTVSTESSEDASPPTKKEQRAAERKAQLGLAASPPDQRRGPDRGIFRDVSREQQEQQQERQYDQRLADEREELRDDRQRRQFDRHGGYGFSNKDKKSKQGWGDPLDDLNADYEMDPADPAADPDEPAQ